MTNLKDAQKNGEINQFIKEREKSLTGDKTKFDKAIKSMVSEKSPKVPVASPKDSSER